MILLRVMTSTVTGCVLFGEWYCILDQSLLISTNQNNAKGPLHPIDKPETQQNHLKQMYA